MIYREINPEPFAALVSSIISQQISQKAAETVWNRLYLLLGDLSPESITRVELSAIKGPSLTLGFNSSEEFKWQSLGISNPFMD